MSHPSQGPPWPSDPGHTAPPHWQAPPWQPYGPAAGQGYGPPTGWGRTPDGWGPPPPGHGAAEHGTTGYGPAGYGPPPRPKSNAKKLAVLLPVLLLLLGGCGVSLAWWYGAWTPDGRFATVPSACSLFDKKTAARYIADPQPGDRRSSRPGTPGGWSQCTWTSDSARYAGKPFFFVQLNATAYTKDKHTSGEIRAREIMLENRASTERHHAETFAEVEGLGEGAYSYVLDGTIPQLRFRISNLIVDVYGTGEFPLGDRKGNPSRELRHLKAIAKQIKSRLDGAPPA